MIIPTLKKDVLFMKEKRDYFISEENFSTLMETVAVPFLEGIKTDAYFEALDGKKIHYVSYRPENPRANIVICHGFTESAEKFLEMSYYFVKMGFNVYAPDHRGHGLSHRHNDDLQIVHIKNFSQYVDDLHTFTKKTVMKECPGLPMYIYSHSMGGAVTVQYLQTHPEVFSKAILSAPMIKARTAGIPEGIARFASRTFILFGKEKNKVVGYKTFNPLRTYEESHDTSKARFDYYQKKRVENTHLQTSAPSYRWVNEAIHVSHLNLDPKRNEKITAKVLLCQPEEDSSVISEMEDVFIKQVRNGRLVKFTDCRHEIYMSIDKTVEEYLDTIESFLAEK